MRSSFWIPRRGLWFSRAHIQFRPEQLRGYTQRIGTAPPSSAQKAGGPYPSRGQGRPPAGRFGPARHKSGNDEISKKSAKRAPTKRARRQRIPGQYTLPYRHLSHHGFQETVFPPRDAPSFGRILFGTEFLMGPEVRAALDGRYGAATRFSTGGRGLSISIRLFPFSMTKKTL